MLHYAAITLRHVFAAFSPSFDTLTLIAAAAFSLFPDYLFASIFAGYTLRCTGTAPARGRHPPSSVVYYAAVSTCYDFHCFTRYAARWRQAGVWWWRGYW